MVRHSGYTDKFISIFLLSPKLSPEIDKAGNYRSGEGHTTFKPVFPAHIAGRQYRYLPIHNDKLRMHD
jgi:hypothetical protein